MKKNIVKLMLEILYLLLYSFILFGLTYIIKYDYLKLSMYIIKNIFLLNRVEYLVVPYLIIVSVQLVIKGLVKDNWKTNIISTIIVLITTIISYYKFKILEVPFVPADILLIGNINQIAEYGITALPIKSILIIALLDLILIIEYIYNKKTNIEKNKEKTKRYIFRVILLLIGIISFYNLCISPNRYIKFNIKNDMGDNYAWMGGNAVFFMHLGDFYSINPDGYNSQIIENIKEEIMKNNGTDKDAIQPNVIMIMNESFSNPHNIKNVEYSINPIQNIEYLYQNDKNCVMRKYNNTCICWWDISARV